MSTRHANWIAWIEPGHGRQANGAVRRAIMPLVCALAITLLAGCPTSLSTVPDVTGLTQSQAATAIQAAGFTVGTVSESTSTTVAAGNVISQSPAAGTSAVTGATIRLTVSTGPGTAAEGEPLSGNGCAEYLARSGGSSIL